MTHWWLSRYLNSQVLKFVTICGATWEEGVRRISGKWWHGGRGSENSHFCGDVLFEWPLSSSISSSSVTIKINRALKGNEPYFSLIFHLSFLNVTQCWKHMPLQKLIMDNEMNLLAYLLLKKPNKNKQT